MNTHLFIHRFPLAASLPLLPTEFPSPFQAEVHPVAELAARQLQQYLSELTHGGSIESEGDTGKMMGVLVILDQDRQPGFLAAFSGKWNGSNHYPGFVPPVFDTLDPEGFYRRGEQEINEINRQLHTLETEPAYMQAHEQLSYFEVEADKDIRALQEAHKRAREQRKTERLQVQSMDEESAQSLLQRLEKESIRHHYLLKDRKKQWKERLEALSADIALRDEPIVSLRNRRRSMSAALQQRLFEMYSFLNRNKEARHLLQIFPPEEGLLPPSGAGECAAPKLLHFAFAHDLHPVAMAEFWWGPSPASEIRKHGYFYPACKSKCSPILAHMLAGLQVSVATLSQSSDDHTPLPIVYDDSYLLVVNKPAEFLSVPGKTPLDSVYNRMKQMFPAATGPIIVHRLDMSTSGLMLLAKTKDVHQHLQRQFLKRTIRKTYVAVLDGLLEAEEGEISLPLRVDLDHRPRQLVCFQHGKPALTRWKKISEGEGQTRVRFYPITGRTHQLRVHAAHSMGLNTPIKGDDLYGRKADRLYLHAESLSFIHPVTGKPISLDIAPDF